jgi:AcrR family transcriptional regulator
LTDTSPAAEPRLRRVPQQARARARIEHVLGTADRVLAAEGAGALSTTRIAEAAGISVGSLYQWFGDKGAIAEALALRYVAEFTAVTAAVADAEEAAPSGDPVGRLLDAFVRAFRERPGFRALWFGGGRTEELRDATRPALADIALLAGRALAANAPQAPPERVATVARMSVLVADAMLRQAFRADEDGDPALLAETRVLLEGYVTERLA